jgi:protein TonB
MRIWSAILASVMVHAALLNVPLGSSPFREVECLEMRLVVEAPSASPQPATSPARAAVQPAADRSPGVVKAPEIHRKPEPPRKKAAPRQKAHPPSEPHHEPHAEPAPANEDAGPAAEPPIETAAADDPANGFEASAGGGEAKQQAAAGGARGVGHDAGSTGFGGSGGPGFIRRVLPRYPRLALQIGREGNVVLDLTIDEHGVLQKAEVAESAGYGFDEEALAAIRASTFRAAVRNGKPVASRARLPVRFMLRGSGND